MSENVKGIMLFIEHLNGYELLSNEQLGILVRALFADIGAREMPEMDATTKLVFELVTPSLHRAQEKLKTRSEINSENGKKGGRPRKNKDNAELQKQNKSEKSEKAIGFLLESEKSKKSLKLNLTKLNDIKENTSYSCQNSENFDEQNEQSVEQEISMEQGELVPQRKKGILQCPQQKILSLYAEILPELPQVQELRANVQRDVSARWKEKCKKRQWATEQDGLEYFKTFFTYVSHNNWLMGRAEGNNGWVCDYRWLMRASNFDAVTSGKYARHQQ